MFRSLRRWWAKRQHRHEFDVVLRFTNRVHVGPKGEATVDTRAILERCPCGVERARYWHNGDWFWFNMDDLNDQWARQGYEPPCRIANDKD